MMNSLRAYNMNLNELIHPEQNRNHVGDRGAVLNDNQKTLINDSTATQKTDAANTNSVQIDISPIWNEVAGQIDLRNATGNEVSDLSAALFQAGAITFEDHINLSFQKGAADEKKDFIAHWREQQEDALHHGAVHEELNDIIRIQSILGYVDSLQA